MESFDDDSGFKSAMSWDGLCKSWTEIYEVSASLLVRVSALHVLPPLARRPETRRSHLAPRSLVLNNLDIGVHWTSEKGP